MKIYYLVDEMPEHCCNCQLCEYDEANDAFNWIICHGHVQTEEDEAAFWCSDERPRPKWCPLRLLPKPCEMHGKPAYSVPAIAADNYNACLRDVIGNTEDFVRLAKKAGIKEW